MNNCPNCGYELVNIVYGKPTKALVDMAIDEGLALGGYGMIKDRPSLYCYGCQESFTK
jgi:hypothetical protein